MRKTAVLFITVLFLLMFIGGVILQSALIFQRIAVVRAVEGDVMVRARKHDTFEPVAGKDRLYAGDTVRTGEDGHLKLEWIDGTRVAVDPDTQMTILKCRMNRMSNSETSLFKLDVGNIWIRVIKVLSQKSKFEVRTPTATAGVRGTVFSVRVDETGETEVSVYEGSVAVSTAKTSETVEKEKVARVASDNLNLQAFSADERHLWESRHDVVQPVLHLDVPDGGYSAAPGETVEIEGNAEPDATVAVGGEPVELKIKHRFEAEITVPEDVEGDTLVVPVTVVDRRGFIAAEDVHITIVR
ncbi:MAG: FecR domain-containing protein [Armatimonadota bacterium]